MVACTPKSSLLLDATLSVGESCRVFDDKLAAAFEEKETLVDARLFPPSEACMPGGKGDKTVEAEGV